MTTRAPRTGVFLTQFPGGALSNASGRPLDWSDHVEAHRAVMRLFSPGLTGDPDRRREASGILYRVDVATNGDAVPERTILVQSLVAPEVTPPVARSFEVGVSTWSMADADRVVFRLAVNPVSRKTIRFNDEQKTKRLSRPRQSGEKTSRRQVASVISPDAIEGWLARRLDGSLTDIELVSHLRDETLSKGHRIVVDTIDAFATVADAAKFDAQRRTGLGRAKAYGCGLITARVVS